MTQERVGQVVGGSDPLDAAFGRDDLDKLIARLDAHTERAA